MKLTKFEIQNFKGISNVSFSFEKRPDNNVYTLVGINESGKTTILEAINFYEYNKEKGLEEIIQKTLPVNFDSIIPIKYRSNFNGSVSIKATLKFTDKDKNDITEFLDKNHNFKAINIDDEFTTIQEYKYQNSNYYNMKSTWSLQIEGKEKNSKKRKPERLDSERWNHVVNYLKERMPKMLYFPTTLFDFPDKIYLNMNATTYKDQFYIRIIQDILDSLNEDLNIEEHIIKRANSDKKIDKDNLKQTTAKMGRILTHIILSEWSSVLGKNLDRIDVDVDKDEKGIYVEFSINGDDGNFKLSERSLGFRWFFVFLLLTQFTGYRRNEDRQVIFLFDEPAANLSQKAQRKLLESLEKISERCSIIYSTHSQYLINPLWLENSYIVTNDALTQDDNSSLVNTNVNLYRYREFVNKFPQQTSYFQPILDILEYVPNDLEMCSNAVLLEGKNDYYNLKYFFNIILELKDIVLIPGMNCTNLNTLISLYSGWGKNFIVLLDSDKPGNKAKNKYTDIFGPLVKDRIFIYADMDQNWQKFEIEDMVTQDDRLAIQNYLGTQSKYSKKEYNKSIQELLMKTQKINLSQSTLENIKKIYTFLNDKLAKDQFMTKVN